MAKIVIAGGGPAGASAAIRLAAAGFDVTLIERERFPRHKLCGEFISPECLKQFGELGVLDEMLSAGGDRISETVFYSRRGRSFSVPSRWFGGDALSLSRSRMDYILLEKARFLGVKIEEGAAVTGIEENGTRIAGLNVRRTGGTSFVAGDIFIDATGRAAAISRFLERLEPARPNPARAPFVAFKNHFGGAEIKPGRCEIYFFPGGYGGFSRIEGGAANFCFLVRSDVARKFGGKAGNLIEGAVSLNPRARQNLAGCRPLRDWMAAAIRGFGFKAPCPAVNVFSVGDAGAFVDPFTGSGMLMALQSAEILAKSIAGSKSHPEQNYRAAHAARFAQRLRICSVLRRAAEMPAFHEPAISLLRFGGPAVSILARATR